MSSPELQRLYRLHETDEAIRTARVRLAALDSGKAKIAILREIKSRLDAAEAHAKGAEAAERDAKIDRRDLIDKADRLEADLYSGRITHAREIADLEHQIETYRHQAAEIETGDAARHEAATFRRAAVAPLQAEFDTERKAAQLEVRRQQIAAEKLTAALAELEPQRIELAAKIEGPLLARYEELRAHHKGIGMARITKTNNCGACGNAIPPRQLEALRDGKIVQCDACRRILYYSEGLF